MRPLYCSTCGGSGLSPCPEIVRDCPECNSLGYLEFDELLPNRTVNAVLEFLRSLPTWEGELASQVVLVAERLGIPNVEILKQYLKDHWNLEVDPLAYNRWELSWGRYWYDP